MVLPRRCRRSAVDDLRPSRLRSSLTVDDRLDDAAAALSSSRRLDQRQRVLGEAGAAIARPWMQELRADAAVEADAAGHILRRRRRPLAKIGDLVDEGDLHREKGVGRILGQLRRSPAR